VKQQSIPNVWISNGSRLKGDKIKKLGRRGKAVPKHFRTNVARVVIQRGLGIRRKGGVGNKEKGRVGNKEGKVKGKRILSRKNDIHRIIIYI
jgi:hypothetical protein